MTTQAEKPLLVFLHIAKTGGTTLMRLFKYRYGDRSHHLSNDDTMLNQQALKDLVENQPYLYDVISGHFPQLEINLYSPRPIYYVTMLRHPVELLVSHYHYIVNSPAHKRHEVFKNLSGLEEGIAHMSRMNIQTRLISGNPRQHDPTREDLEIAKQNLEKHFRVAGVLERYDDTLIAFKQRLGWNNIPVRKIHRNRGKNRPQNLPDSLYTQLLEQNRLDLELWEFAGQLLDRQLREHAFDTQMTRLLLQSGRTTVNTLSAVKARVLRRKAE